MARAQGDLKNEDISNFFADSIIVAKRKTCSSEMLLRLYLSLSVADIACVSVLQLLR